MFAHAVRSTVITDEVGFPVIFPCALINECKEGSSEQMLIAVRPNRASSWSHHHWGVIVKPLMGLVLVNP